MYEKQEIKWFSINMLRVHKKKFRTFFQEVVSKIIKNEKNIKSLFHKKTRKKKMIHNKTVKNK